MILTFDLSMNASTIVKELAKHGQQIPLKSTRIKLLNKLRQLNSLPPLVVDDNNKIAHKVMVFPRKITINKQAKAKTKTRRKIKLKLKLKTKTRTRARKIPKTIVLNALINNYLKVLSKPGPWPGTEQEYSNCDDFMLGTPINLIPICYQFELISKTGHRHMFDVRSLNKAVTVNGPINPYTQNKIQSQDLIRLSKKTTILRKIGLHDIVHQGQLSDLEKQTAYANSIFSKLYLIGFYVHVSDFLKVPFGMLKSLYYEVFDIWNYRVDLTLENKLKIINTGLVFNEWDIVKNIPDTDDGLLKIRRKILISLNRLLTEGDTASDRYLGATYFMLGYVLVSKEAASAAPHLYSASS